MTLPTKAIYPSAVGAIGLVLVLLGFILWTAAALGDTTVQPQADDHQLLVPNVVGNADGTYAPYATATPSPTPVGVQDATDRFFVSGDGDDEDAGTRDAPFATISRALEVARLADSAEIYVASSTYTETIYLVEQPPVRILGGYDPGDWVRNPGAYSFILPADSMALLIAGSSDVHVEGFDLRSGSAPLPEPLDRSRAAVVIEFSSAVTLRDNLITAGDGLRGVDGVDGAQGDRGSDGQDGDDWGVCPPTNSGGAGGAGYRKGGRGGDGGAIGGSPGGDGASASAVVTGGAGGRGGDFTGHGAVGLSGDYGTTSITVGQSGGAIGTFGFSGYLPANGADGVSVNRTGGAGGGGGGGGGGALFFVCGGGGGGGGGGGFPAKSDGTGGGAGGGSYAVMIQASEVSLVDNQITTGNGGIGGDGGDGAEGGVGGAGGAGGGGGDGGIGGWGGTGGHSAPGGGGGGGPSIGILAGGVSDVQRLGNSFNLGNGGAGGLAGRLAGTDARPPAGQTGFRVEFYQESPPG